MGQYYTPVLEKDNDIKQVNPNSLHHWPMVKLMEHSFINNEYVDTVANLIYKNPTKLVWLGDYGDDEIKSHFPDSQLTKKGGTTEHLEDIDIEELYKTNVDEHGYITFDYTNKWFVNHDLKIGINFNDYIDLCKKQGVISGLKGEITYDPTFIVSPIPLLTAAGNGNGGGDYMDSINMDLVGEWTYSNVSIEDTLPEGYAVDNTTYFLENW